MRRLTMCTAAALLVASWPGASDAAAQNALSFTRIDRSPRTAAMAGAGMSAAAGEGYAAFSGAARMGFLEGKGDAAAAIHLWEMSNEADKSTHFQGGGAVLLGRWGLALGAAWQSSVEQGSYTPSDRLVSLGLSFQLTPWLSIGLNGRYAAQHFTREASVNGVSADFSLVGRLGKEVFLGATLGSVGNEVKGASASYSQPAYLRAGLDWEHAFSSRHALALLLDAEYNFDGTAALAIGGEYAWNHCLYARAGYRLAGEKALIPSHLALGTGVKLTRFRMELAYLTASPLLGNTLSLGVGLNF